MKKTLKLVAALTAVVMMAGACGDDDGGGGGSASADSPLVQAIVDDMMADEGAMTSDRGEAECFVGGVVGGVGEDRLTELGVTESNVPALDEIEWTQGEAESIVDSMFDCIDMGESFMSEMEFGDLDDAQTECVQGVFTEDVLKDFFVASLTNDEEAGSGIMALFGELAECGIDF